MWGKSLFTAEENLRIKLHLSKKMGKFLEDETKDDNNLGWIPDDLHSRMADAAFAVLEATQSLNVYLEKEGAFEKA